VADTVTAPPETSQSIDRQTFWVTAYRRYYRLWISLARSSQASEEDAQDIVHGVIASILNNGSPEFESFEHLRNYVAKSVLNRVILHRKQMQRRAPLVDVNDLISDTSGDAVREETPVDTRMLIAIVRKLKRRDFEIIKLRFFSGLTFVEISQLTGRAVSTLKSREVSALKKIEKALRKKRVERLL
jgi:RNA polymerase sigma factor (sigma-70 family)